MNPRSTALLLLVAAALGAFVYFYEVRGSEQRREAALNDKRLFPGVKSTDITWIRLTTTDGKPARVERKDGTWRVVEPISFPADAVNLDAMAAGLADLAREKEIDAPQAPAVYGIDANSRSVFFGAGGQEHELRIGKKAPVGSNTYVVTGARPEHVVTVPTFKTTNLERSLDDLRDRRVLNFDRAAIDRVEVSWPGERVVLERADGGWKVVEPVKGPADDATVDSLLSNLSYLRADSFDDAPAPDAKTGLDAPAFEVTLTGRPPAEGKEAPRFHLAFGAEQNGKRLVRAAQPSLYRVAAQRMGEFPRSVSAYRFKELANFVATDAKTLELTLADPGGTPLSETITHETAGWQGSPETVDPGKAARLVAELARLRGSDIAAEGVSESDLTKFGLAPPHATIRVLAAASGEVAPAELGAVEIGADPDGAGPYARRPKDGTVYRLAPTVKEWLPSDAASFRSLFVVKPSVPSLPAPAAAPGTEGSGASKDPEALAPPGD